MAGSVGLQCSGFAFEGARALDWLESCCASVSSAQGGGQLAVCHCARDTGEEFGFQDVGTGAKTFATRLGASVWLLVPPCGDLCGGEAFGSNVFTGGQLDLRRKELRSGLTRPRAPREKADQEY